MFAVRDPVAAAQAGLDLPGLDDAEGRRPEDFTSGRIGPDRLDDVVTRMVGTMVTHDLLDRPAAVPGPPPPEHRELAADVAVAGSVLLVNRAEALPLREDVSSLAVIGPAGLDAIYVMGGSPAVKLHPHRVVTPLAGIRRRAGSRIRVEHAQGSWGDVPLPTIPPALLSTPPVPGTPAGPGVLAEYVDGPGHVPGKRVTRIRAWHRRKRSAARLRAAMAGHLDDRADSGAGRRPPVQSRGRRPGLALPGRCFGGGGSTRGDPHDRRTFVRSASCHPPGRRPVPDHQGRV